MGKREPIDVRLRVNQAFLDCTDVWHQGTILDRHVTSNTVHSIKLLETHEVTSDGKRELDEGLPKIFLLSQKLHVPAVAITINDEVYYTFKSISTSDTQELYEGNDEAYHVFKNLNRTQKLYEGMIEVLGHLKTDVIY